MPQAWPKVALRTRNTDRDNITTDAHNIIEQCSGQEKNAPPVRGMESILYVFMAIAAKGLLVKIIEYVILLLITP
jgi:hypothetical protein